MRAGGVSPVDVPITIGFVAGLKWWGRYRRVEVIGRCDIDQVEGIPADARTEDVGHSFGVTGERHAGRGEAVEGGADWGRFVYGVGGEVVSCQARRWTRSGL